MGIIMSEQFKKYIHTYTHNLFNSTTKICVVKHYNTFEITENIIPPLSNFVQHIYYHDFSGVIMQNAYEPFLDIISDMYKKYYAPKLSDNDDITENINNFWRECNVYPLHFSILTSYVKTGVCSREEDLILSEAQYEHDRFLDGIVNIFAKITAAKAYTI